jgi:Predicted transcriptional regulators
MRNKILQALIQSPHKRDDALPSVRMLMATFKASSGTVQAVLRQLQDNGQIYCIRGKGCFWGSSPTQIQLPKPRESALAKLNRLFEDDWKHGEYKPTDPLPLLKEMAERYHASLPLLRQIPCAENGGRHPPAKWQAYFFAQNHREAFGNSGNGLSELIFVTRCNSWAVLQPKANANWTFCALSIKQPVPASTNSSSWEWTRTVAI